MLNEHTDLSNNMTKLSVANTNLALMRKVAQLTASGVPAMMTSDIRLSFLLSAICTVAPENCL